jgi:hypothetical protein
MKVRVRVCRISGGLYSVMTREEKMDEFWTDKQKQDIVFFDENLETWIVDFTPLGRES